MSDKNTKEIVTGYKAFDPDFTWRGYQFEVGKTVEYDGEIDHFSDGFYFYYTNPIDIFRDYPLIDENGLPLRFAKISSARRDAMLDPYRIGAVTSKINIDKELSFQEVVRTGIKEEIKKEDRWGRSCYRRIAREPNEYLTTSVEHVRLISKKFNTHVAMLHRYSLAVVSGIKSRLASCGFENRLITIGKNDRISSSGFDTEVYSRGKEVRVASSGERANLQIVSLKATVASSGDEAELRIVGNGASVASSGEKSTVCTRGNNASVSVSGHSTKLTVTGKRSRIAAVGDGNQVIYDGTDGVISMLGMGAEFKGSEGTLVSAVVYDKESKPIDIIMGRIGENGLKPDTLYTVSDGKFVEVEA